MISVLTVRALTEIRLPDAYVDPMAFRRRDAYDESVPRALREARVTFDAATAAYEEHMTRARVAWAESLAAALDAGMSYQEIADEVGVSHTSISRAIKQHRSS